MKYWRGYLTAGILGIFTWMLMDFADGHSKLVDMVYPYITRLIQDNLANWTSSVEFCLWQVAAVALIVLFLGTLVLMIVMRWNPIQWFGWVTAAAVGIFALHTLAYGLNTYAGPISEDIRMEEMEYTTAELEAATAYYLEQANLLSTQISRDEAGNPVYPEFEPLAQMAADGFHSLVYDYSYPIFAGNTLPVKKLGWSDMYTSMSITGVTMGLTGEAAVNPDIPVVSLPFTMCHEMAHRMCITIERDANFAAFLACMANENVEYRYSAYFMAFRYCYNSLVGIGTQEASDAAGRLFAAIGKELQQDLDQYRAFFQVHRDQAAADLANTANDTYIKVSGDEQGVASYGDVSQLLVSWHIQQFVLPTLEEDDVQKFDPFDRDRIDLSTNITPPKGEE